MGGGGRDRLRGGRHSDDLAGGGGHDRINGDRGYDYCFEGESYRSCEGIAAPV